VANSVVIVPGSPEIDLSTSPELARQLAGHGAEDHIIVDLAGVTFCDSSGIGVLITAWRRQSSAGGSIRVVNLTHHIARIFELMGVTSVLVGATDAGAV
jgi:anti-sigma B factor antagonist